MIPDVGSVALRHKDVKHIGVEGLEELLVIGIGDDLCRDPVFVEKLLQNIDHRAVQHADLLPAQRGRIRRDVRFRVLLDQIVGFGAHDRVGIADQPDSLLPPREPGQQIYFAVQKHLIQVPVSAVHVFVFPSRVLGELAVILVGVPRLHRALFRAFLEDLVLVISHADGLRARVRKGMDGQKGPEQQRKERKAQPPPPCPVPVVSSDGFCFHG